MNTKSTHLLFHFSVLIIHLSFLYDLHTPLFSACPFSGKPWGSDTSIHLGVVCSALLFSPSLYDRSTCLLCTTIHSSELHAHPLSVIFSDHPFVWHLWESDMRIPLGVVCSSLFPSPLLSMITTLLSTPCPSFCPFVMLVLSSCSSFHLEPMGECHEHPPGCGICSFLLFSNFLYDLSSLLHPHPHPHPFVLLSYFPAHPFIWHP